MKTIKFSGDSGFAMKNILIVDDEEGMRIALSEALSRAGFETTCCKDGREAVARIRSNKYSMVISDVKMPGMDGMEVLRSVNKISPETPVVMITAFGTVDNAVEAMKEGACDYLLKPFSFENVVEIVKSGLFQSKSSFERQKMSDGGGFKNRAGKKREIVTSDREMIRLLDMACEIALSNSTVIIYGESGTGKELVAHLIHDNSHRKEKPFVAVNCAAIPDNLLESELFGHEKGSFTGATFRKFGKFELAQGGTLLLDEIGEMTMTLQAKLLRVLQEFEIDRIGGKEPVPIDVRIISTTNIDLKKAVNENKFREDLYYRLNVIPIKIPTLSARKCDVELLANHFVKKNAEKNNKNVASISREALDLLKNRPWKGNVRELQNVIERAVLLCKGDTISVQNILLEEGYETGAEKDEFPVTTIEDMERRLIMKTLDEKAGNRTHAAHALGISIRTLRNKLKEYKERNLVIESV